MKSAFLRSFLPINPGAFRLALALLVFAHHSSRLGFGKYAVYVFFALSGFWVERMWSAKYKNTVNPIITYSMSRLMRLSPIFILVSILVVLAEMAIGVSYNEIIGGNVYKLIFSTVFIFGYSSLSYLPIGPAWSLDMEIQFYAMAPIISYFMRNFSVKFVLIASCIVSIFSSLFMGEISILNYVGFFCVGMAASVTGWRPSENVAAISIGAVLLSLFAVLLSPYRGILLGGASPNSLYAWNPVFNIAEAIITIPFAIYTTSQISDVKDRMMADMSYIVYLLHWPIFIWMTKIGGAPLHRLPYLILGWIAVLMGSWLIWRFFDQPINRFRAKWVAARATR